MGDVACFPIMGPMAQATKTERKLEVTGRVVAHTGGVLILIDSH